VHLSAEPGWVGHYGGGLSSIEPASALNAQLLGADVDRCGGHSVPASCRGMAELRYPW
jgi:hypothetical protein